MSYNFKFEHIKGKDNVFANILSRCFTGKLQNNENSEVVLLYEEYP